MLQLKFWSRGQISIITSVFWTMWRKTTTSLSTSSRTLRVATSARGSMQKTPCRTEEEVPSEDSRVKLGVSEKMAQIASSSQPSALRENSGSLKWSLVLRPPCFVRSKFSATWTTCLSELGGMPECMKKDSMKKWSSTRMHSISFILKKAWTAGILVPYQWAG